MKNIIVILLFITTLSSVHSVNAQMSKSEKKEWNKRIKSLTPEQYKALLEENKSMKSEMSSLKKEVAGTDDKIKEKDDQIADYQDQVSNLRRQVAEAKKAAEAAPQEVATNTRNVNTTPTKGVVFKVQIGAFKLVDMKKFALDNPGFEVDEKDGTMKYTVGMFRDYWEADTFKKNLRHIGVKDAWVVSYKDGKRVELKEVLEGSI